MIVLDIETSGIDSGKCGIWQIGAIDTDTLEEFFGECRIDPDDVSDISALDFNRKTEEQLKTWDRQTQKELLEKFFSWIEKRKVKNFLCHNPVFDVAWIETKARKYGLKIPFHYRSFDLHSFAQSIYKQIKGQFLLEKDHSAMGLSKVLEFCGMEDMRGVHNALEDCKLEAECFSRLTSGKNLFPEYAQYPLPNYL